jgi:hypothetical protein
MSTRYSNDRMSVRAQSLSVLLKNYGSQLDTSRKSKYTNQSIYQCAHDWISMGNMNTNGIVKYYEVHYSSHALQS